jgi:heterodisulfide reductase subunit B
MCPNCAIQFDRHHDIIQTASDEVYPFVHMHVQQLLALALGADPDKDCGLDSHSQDVEPLLKRIGVRHTARAQAARANAGAPR